MAQTAEVYWGTGHRKDACARVRLMRGTGQIIINGQAFDEYLRRYTLEEMVLQPFIATDTLGQFDVIAKAEGGGVCGQAGAVRHGIARALVKVDEGYRHLLRRARLLTRDPRVKERKKAGRKRARRGQQFSKR